MKKRLPIRHKASHLLRSLAVVPTCKVGCRHFAVNEDGLAKKVAHTHVVQR